MNNSLDMLLLLPEEHSQKLPKQKYLKNLYFFSRVLWRI